MSDRMLLAGFAAGIVLVIALVMGAGYAFERKACANRADEMGLDHKFKLVGGCFVALPSGRYVNLSNIRFTEQGQILVEP
jgi:hypothetical protein